MTENKFSAQIQKEEFCIMTENKFSAQIQIGGFS